MPASISVRLRVEKQFERYAWILLFLVGIVFSPPIFYNLVTEPRDNVNLVSLLLGFAVTTVLISSTSYRKGKKWAWYLLWYVPVFWVIAGYLQYASGGQIPLVTIILSPIPVLGLLLPYRKFFPRRELRPR